MKKIRSYTSIWNVEKVLYALRPKVTYAGKAVNLHKQKFEEIITAVRSVTYVPD